MPPEVGRGFSHAFAMAAADLQLAELQRRIVGLARELGWGSRGSTAVNGAPTGQT
ncbi:MAG: hypothetical protein KBE23_13950 [Chloroflexi bacterium]|nr:hypothetical protein [Chloroflexota bacterium]MBP7043844.1 hypothetical protein [Chloroflexota bacterium]